MKLKKGAAEDKNEFEDLTEDTNCASLRASRMDLHC